MASNRTTMRITLGQYIDLMELFKGKDLDNKTSTEIYAEYPEMVESIIQICTDADLAELTATQIVGLLDVISANIAIGEPTEHPPFFQIGEKIYHPVANFEAINSKAELEKIVFGTLNFGDTLETLRLDQLINENNYKMFPYVLANIYRDNPESHVNERAQEFLKLDVADAIGAYFFLSSIENGFITNLSNHSARTTEVPTTNWLANKVAKIRWRVLDGITRLEQRLEIYLLTKKLNLDLLMKSLRTYFTKE